MGIYWILILQDYKYTHEGHHRWPIRIALLDTQIRLRLCAWRTACSLSCLTKDNVRKVDSLIVDKAEERTVADNVVPWDGQLQQRTFWEFPTQLLADCAVPLRSYRGRGNQKLHVREAKVAGLDNDAHRVGVVPRQLRRQLLALHYMIKNINETQARQQQSGGSSIRRAISRK